MGLQRGRDALRRIAYDRVWRWPVWARVGLGASAAVCTATAWAKRGAAVGVLALAVIATMAVAAFAGERWALWVRRHRRASQLLGIGYFGALTFLASAVITNWSPTRCALQSAGGVCVLACWFGWRRYWHGQHG
jgi:hypothetical protein